MATSQTSIRSTASVDLGARGPAGQVPPPQPELVLRKGGQW